MCQNSWLTPCQLEFSEKLLKEILFQKDLILDKNCSMKRTITWCRFLSETQCNPRAGDPTVRVSPQRTPGATLQNGDSGGAGAREEGDCGRCVCTHVHHTQVIHTCDLLPHSCPLRGDHSHVRDLLLFSAISSGFAPVTLLPVLLWTLPYILTAHLQLGQKYLPPPSHQYG